MSLSIVIKFHPSLSHTHAHTNLIKWHKYSHARNLSSLYLNCIFSPRSKYCTCTLHFLTKNSSFWSWAELWEQLNQKAPFIPAQLICTRTKYIIISIQTNPSFPEHDNWHEIHSYNRKLADLCHITYYKNWLFSPQKHQARLQAGLQTLKTVPIFPVVDFVWFYQYIFMQQKYFFCFASNFSSSGHSLPICSWPLKSRKSLACDAADSSASHASLVRDVTDTDCLTPNGYAHCCFVFTTYRTKKKKTESYCTQCY